MSRNSCLPLDAWKHLNLACLPIPSPGRDKILTWILAKVLKQQFTPIRSLMVGPRFGKGIGTVGIKKVEKIITKLSKIITQTLSKVLDQL